MIKKTFLLCLTLAFISTATFAQTTHSKKLSNKELVRAAMTALFGKRDLSAIDKYWGKTYIQHNPHIPNGHEALKKIITGLGPNFKYEPGFAMEEGDFVMIHGRYIGWAEKPMLAIDVFKVKNGKLVEHWDVMQEEVPADKTASGNAMFPIN